MNRNRRTFIRSLGQAAAGYSLLPSIPLLFSGCDNTSNRSSSSITSTDSAAASQPTASKSNTPFFKISLAEWSLNKAIKSGKMTNLDFPVKAKNEFGIDAVEYVDQLFKDKSAAPAYLAELKKICDDNGVTSVLIMVDTAGHLADTNTAKRRQAVENHHKWVDAAKFLGCHSIRVNAAGEGTAEEVAKAAVDGLSRLTEYGVKNNINIIVENHGGYSSNGQWLANVIKQVNMPHCGTLPDFGNFNISETEQYDKYKGVQELMPYAKGVSAKSFDFDASGNENTIDFKRMLQIVKDAGYNGYVGIEYEGDRMSEEEGIMATKRLLERVGSSLA